MSVDEISFFDHILEIRDENLAIGTVSEHPFFSSIYYKANESYQTFNFK